MRHTLKGQSDDVVPRTVPNCPECPSAPMSLALLKRFYSKCLKPKGSTSHLCTLKLFCTVQNKLKFRASLQFVGIYIKETLISVFSGALRGKCSMYLLPFISQPN